MGLKNVVEAKNNVVKLKDNSSISQTLIDELLKMDSPWLTGSINIFLASV